MSGSVCEAEWLEADSLGGFASGTVDGARTRRYHALLLAALPGEMGRLVLVNGIEAWVMTGSGRVALTSQCYCGDPRPGGGTGGGGGTGHPIGFRRDPWPVWTHELPGGGRIEQEIFVAPDSCETVLRWRATGVAGRLCVRPLLSGRDYHALHRENPNFDFAGTVRGGDVAWRPYPDLPAVAALSNGAYRQEPDWYRNFFYPDENERGLDAVEDLASPGVFEWDFGAGEAVLILRVGDGLSTLAAPYARMLAEAERNRRAAFVNPLSLAADSYIVDRGARRTIMAGFPWFTDWGRDTFISMRGLALGTGRLAEAEAILRAWAGLVSQGMLPNRFPDGAGEPEYNSVDASLWYVVAVHDFLAAMAASGSPANAGLTATLHRTVDAILDGYSGGTRFGIGADSDGLLRCGVPGVQLTWMDAKVDDWVVTPRIGKPVEIQALWINALRIAGAWSPRWVGPERAARMAFLARFPNPATGGLFDVVDPDHRPGTADEKVRPNQIFAIGGLPFPLIEGEPARRVVALVERTLLTPMGLRTLAPDDPDYAPRYEGDRRARDGAYHQGTVWPWLIGPFVEAWLRVHGDDAASRAEAAARFLAPLRVHLGQAGLGHVSEIADGDAPHTPRGCPFQAWSLGELIRAEALLASAPHSTPKIIPVGGSL